MNFSVSSAKKHLEKNWDNVDCHIAFLGPEKLHKFYKVLSYSKICEILSSFESYSLMRLGRKQKEKNPTLALHVRDVFQIDLVHVTELAALNNGVNYLFCCIDIFSKRAWVIPEVAATGQGSIESLKIILNSINIAPRSIIADAGPEFDNKKFKAYLNKMGIKLIFTESENKASTCERFQRTLQCKIYSYITQKENLRYIDILDKIVRNYNLAHHSFLETSPINVEKNKHLQNILMVKHAAKLFNLRRKKPKFQVNDCIRVSLKKKTFSRSYNIQNTYERFIITSVNNQLPIPRYRVKDELNNDIKGFFLENEIIKINIPKYRAIIIDKRKRKGKTEFLHRFKGYSEKFDLWLTLSQADPTYF